MKYIVLVALSLAFNTSAGADQLPKKLLLNCEGKLTTISNYEGMKPDVHQDKFATTLRLKDGELADADSIYLTTNGRELSYRVAIAAAGCGTSRHFAALQNW
jgi:hypothetical protein